MEGSNQQRADNDDHLKENHMMTAEAPYVHTLPEHTAEVCDDTESLEVRVERFRLIRSDDLKP